MWCFLLLDLLLFPSALQQKERRFDEKKTFIRNSELYFFQPLHHENNFRSNFILDKEFHIPRNMISDCVGILMKKWKNTKVKSIISSQDFKGLFWRLQQFWYASEKVYTSFVLSLMLLMLQFIMWFMFLSNMSPSYQVFVEENRTHSTVHYKWTWPKN